jgi:hypothetical protein
MLTEGVTVALFPAKPVVSDCEAVWTALFPGQAFESVEKRPTEGGSRASGLVNGYQVALSVQPIRVEVAITGKLRGGSSKAPPQIGDESPDAMFGIARDAVAKLSILTDSWDRIGFITNCYLPFKDRSSADAALRSNVAWAATMPDGLLDLSVQFNERSESELSGRKLTINSLARFLVTEDQFVQMGQGVPSFHSYFTLRRILDVNNAPSQDFAFDSEMLINGFSELVGRFSEMRSP